MAGYRYFNSGSLSYVGVRGHYWSSTPADNPHSHKSRFLNYYSIEEDLFPEGGGLSGGLYYGDHASGLSVRCIKD